MALAELGTPSASAVVSALEGVLGRQLSAQRPLERDEFSQVPLLTPFLPPPVPSQYPPVHPRTPPYPPVTPRIPRDPPYPPHPTPTPPYPTPPPTHPCLRRVRRQCFGSTRRSKCASPHQLVGVPTASSSLRGGLSSPHVRGGSVCSTRAEKRGGGSLSTWTLAHAFRM